MSIALLLDQLSQQGIQLWFEGSRLRFRGPRGALTAEQRSQLVERRDEVIAELRARAAAEPRIVPLSYGQRSLWFVNQDEPGSAAYHVAFVVEVKSAVDRAALQDAFQALVDRHAILRTTYAIVDGQASQLVAGTGVAAFDVHEVPGIDEAGLKARVEADYLRPFDLRKGPVLRTTLYSRGAADHVLLVNAHHIAIDGWSLLILLEELRALYAESTAGTPAALPRPELQYTDYTQWQAQMLASPEGETLARYWQDKLAAPRAEVELPPDRPRPARKSVRGATFTFEIDAALNQRLAQLARAEGTTQFVLLLAAFKVLLFRYSGTEDIVVGTPTLGRNNLEFGRVLGHFVNPVPLRSRLDGQMSFRQLTADLRKTLIEALEGQEYPLPLMVERLHPRRDPSRSPLFETLFVLQRFEQFRELSDLLAVGELDTPLSDFGGLKVRPYDLRQQEGQFDLGLGLVDKGDALGGAFKYNTDLFDAATMGQLARHYCQLLWSIVEQPQEQIGRLSLLDKTERRLVIETFNDTALDVEPVPVAVGVEQQVDRTPEAPALAFKGTVLSYRALNARANQIAHRLRALGVGPGVLVGLCAERSLDLLAAVLGILKAGGGYVPLDPGFPSDRLVYMLEDSACTVLVTAGNATQGLDVPRTVRVLHLDRETEVLRKESIDNPLHDWRPDDPAYVLYTSGSTGRPKGVVVPQGAFVNFLASMLEAPGMSPSDVLAAVTTISFDIAGLDMFLPLLVGARIELVPRDIAADGIALSKLLTQCGATVLQATPVTWRMLVEAGWRGGPNFRAFTGGEPLPRDLAYALLDRVGELWNQYGPTETTVYSTRERVEKEDGPITIGRPVANTQIYILDANGEPVPVGVTGEMWIAGAGLATGYQGRPDLTAERFVADPFSKVPGARMYRTGDAGRWRADGRVEHFGRLDNQVKVRGFRIELGEIESVLARHAAVRECAVVVRQGTTGDVRLVAYVAANGSAPIVGELREHLGKQLPDYMVPAAFVFIDKLPLTGSGKVNRNALPAPEAADTPAVEGYAAPSTETEKAVAQVFADVLDVPAVGVHDNFFELGGHSLLATRALARLRERFEFDVPLIALFQAPTVEGLSRWLDAAASKDAVSTLPEDVRAVQIADWKCLVPTQANGSSPPLFLITGYMDADDTLRILSNLIPHLGPEQPLCGLRPRWLDGHSPQYSSVAEMTAEYLKELRTFQPHGPYYILGDCVGGVVAVEVARTLIEQHEEVALLVLLDTERPRAHSFILGEIVRLWNRGQHVAEVIGRVLRPVEKTRKDVLSEIMGRKLRQVGLNKSPISTNDHIYAQRIAYQRLLKKHRLKRYPGRIDLIVSDDIYPFLVLLGWNGFADGGVKVHRTPGDHQTFRAQYSREFGQQLRLCIDRAKNEI